MKFLSDQELYSNVTLAGTIDFTPYQQAIGENIPEYKQITSDEAMAGISAESRYLANQMNVYLWKRNHTEAHSRGIEREAEMSPREAGNWFINQLLEKVEELYQQDHIGGFMSGHKTVADQEVDYFDSHPINSDRNSPRFCGGAFGKLHEILSTYYRPDYCFGCLLMSVLCFFVLTQNLDGYVGFFACAVMVLTPLVYFLSEQGEDGICKIVCNPLVKAAVLVVSALGVISRTGSPIPEFVLVLRYYYMVAIAAQLVDIVLKYFKTFSNGKKRKEYRQAYEHYAPQIHRYIRYHVLWWNNIHPGEPLHENIKKLQNEFDYFTKRYKKG